MSKYRLWHPKRYQIPAPKVGSSLLGEGGGDNYNNKELQPSLPSLPRLNIIQINLTTRDKRTVSKNILYVVTNSLFNVSC